MNPTLLQHPAFDLPLSSETKYLGQERSYSNLSGFPTNDSQFLRNRTLNSLTNSTPSSSLVVSASTGLEYNAQPSFTDTSYHSNSHLLLSPPDSTGGSSATGGIPTSSPFANSTLPKPYASNVSTTDHFAGGSGALLPSTWRDPAMTTLDRPHLSLFPPTLSPPQHFNSASGMHGYSRGTIMQPPPFDRYPPNAPNHNSFIHRQTVFQPRPPFSPFPPQVPYAADMPMSAPGHSEGPPFNDTQIIHHPLNSQGTSLRPEIGANIHKGFFQVEGKWTCYRRNYFTVACSFTFDKPADGVLYLKHGHDKHAAQIQHFAVSISAKTAAGNNQDSEDRGLVQHTPKRNKESESTPTRHVVVPAVSQQQHQNNGMSLSGLYSGAHPHNPYHYPNYHDPPAQTAPSSYTFERIQFQKATANNGKRRAQQQYFHVVVELHACVNSKHGEEWIKIATRESAEMVVRGRSPGHYKDRRDSQTSMDPEGRAGPGSDGSGGHSYNPGYSDWSSGHSGYQSTHNRGHSEGYHRNHSMMNTSPCSGGSSTTLTESPSDVEYSLSDADTLKSSEMFSLDRSRMNTPPSEGPDESFFALNSVPKSRKRRLEEDSADDEPSYGCAQPYPDGSSRYAFDFAPMAPSKILCAS